jgi:tetratricopeptide (TPR) repeat protein
MAKRNSQTKGNKRKQQTLKSKYSVQFIFPCAGDQPVSPEYLQEFADKIKSENVSRSIILCLHHGDFQPYGDHKLVKCLDLRHPSSLELIESMEGSHAVIIQPGILESHINPNEFFRLDLPEDSREKKYYEIAFKGKMSEGRAGLILPSEALRYMVTALGKEVFPEPGVAGMVLKKLGFVREEVVLHQDISVRQDHSGKIPFIKRLKLQFSWNTIMPFREWKDPSLRSLFFNKEHPLFRVAFLFTSILIFIILPILSLDAGLSGDDEKHYQHAIKVYRYYTEDDPAALDDPRFKLNYYGQSFDFFTYLLIRLFNLEDHPYEARHVMVAVTGAAAILFTGLLVRLFAGYGGGWLALVLMFLSPRFLGHAFNNPMDVPFALGNIFTLYHLILFLKKLPRISARSSIWIAVGIGWSNGIRIGGLLLVPYLFMFAGLYLLLHRWPWQFFSAQWWRFALKGLMTLVAISVGGYLLSILTWPYALQDIVNHPIQAFKIMTNIQVSIRVLYDGLIYWSDHLPWHYIPKNIWITVPVIILLGWLTSAFTWMFNRKEKQGYWYFMLWFTVLFPVVFIIYRESNVYGGWRHMMFIYPSMLALAAISLTQLIRISNSRWIRLAVPVLVGIGVLHPLRHTIVNHPNTYIYFNEWSGGINSTYGKYETDYYANSMRPATDYFLEELLPQASSGPGDTIRVVSNSDISYYFRGVRDQVTPFYSRYYDRGKYDWDYAILYCNYIHPYQLNHELWPPNNTVGEIKVDDVVVAAVVERRNRDDYFGSSLLAEGIRGQDPAKMSQAIFYLESAITFDNNNEAAHLELGNAYVAFGRFEEARATMDRLLDFYPDYDKALNLKGYTYLVEAEVKQDWALLDRAILIINQAIQSNYKFYSGYYNLGLCYGMKNDKDNAIYNFKQAIRYNGRFRAAYEKLAEVYEYYGETEMANSVRARLNRL